MMYLYTPEQHKQVLDALEGIMEWQVKNVKVWHNSAYDNAEPALAALKAMQPVEPCTQQFQGRDGTWYGFHDTKHYENTVADGSWPIRSVYTPTKD